MQSVIKLKAALVHRQLAPKTNTQAMVRYVPVRQLVQLLTFFVGTDCGADGSGLQCANGICTSRDLQCREQGSSLGVERACSSTSSCLIVRAFRSNRPECGLKRSHRRAKRLAPPVVAASSWTLILQMARLVVWLAVAKAANVNKATGQMQRQPGFARIYKFRYLSSWLAV